MSAYTQSQATNVLAGTLGQAAFVASVAPVKQRLMSANGSEAAAGTEITAGGSYTAGGLAIPMNAPTVQTGTYSGRIGCAALSYTNMPAVGGGGVVGVEEWDSSGTPRRLMWGALTVARTTSLGDTLSFPSDSVVAQS